MTDIFPTRYMENITNQHLKKAKEIKVNKAHTKTFNMTKQFLGLSLYIAVFIIIIPVLLYKFKFFTILEGYLPNIDLLATCLSWHGGPYDIWTELYPTTPITTYGFLSKSFINYGALLGLTYIVAREAKLTNSTIKGWSLGLVMLLITYLLPSNFITHAMNDLNKYLKGSMPNQMIITLAGLIMSLCIILLESFIISYFRHALVKVGKSIIQFPKKF